MGVPSLLYSPNAAEANLYQKMRGLISHCWLRTGNGTLTDEDGAVVIVQSLHIATRLCRLIVPHLIPLSYGGCHSVVIEIKPQSCRDILRDRVLQSQRSSGSD